MKNIILIFGAIIIMSSCNTNKTQNDNLTSNIKKNNSINKIEINRETDKTKELTDISLKILNNLIEKENILISPLSISTALAIAENGANGKTLSEIEKFFQTDVESLNNFLYTYTSSLPNNKEKYKLSLANSVWILENKNLIVENDFLQKSKDFYNAEIYKTLFDENAKNKINNWVSKKTEGEITELLSETPPKDAIMYLINALFFDGKWAVPYKDYQITKDNFTTASGKKQKVDFLHSTENLYIELENAEGFAKPYAENKYFFVALLPNKNISLNNFLETLDANNLIDAIKTSSMEKVITSMPKFEFSYDTLLNDTLKNLGMVSAFDEDKADFSKMATFENKNIFISRVIHKTKIKVDEQGSKASAVSAVEMVAKTALIPQEMPKTIILNRPFLFMIVDAQNNFPIFLGALNDIASDKN